MSKESFATAVMQRGTSRRVGVGQTTLVGKNGQRLPFWGLHAISDIPRGGFVGLYAGNFFEEDDPQLPKKNAYAMNGSGYTVIPPAHPTHGVHPFMYPIAMINEPPTGVRANVAIVEWSNGGQGVPGMRKAEPINMLAIHATEFIPLGSEIFLNYGSRYDRRHYPKGTVVGWAATPIGRSAVPKAEQPRAYLERIGEVAPQDTYE